MLVTVVVVVVALLGASAALSAVEAAVFALSNSHVRTLAEERYDGAQALARVRGEPEPVRSALLFCVVVLNVVCVGIVVASSVQGWGTRGALISIPVAALVTVLFGEFLPRMLAARSPVRLALSSARFLVKLERVVRPLLFPFKRLRELLVRHEDPDSTVEGRQLREMTEIGREEGVLVAEEGELVARAFRLDELTARDVMTPRVNVFAWDGSLELRDIVNDLGSVPYSRVPVYGESIDDVQGILYVREAYRAYVTGHEDIKLRELVREPLFVPGSLSLNRLLRNFQARRLHMGIVADEFGGMDGIVTLEDVLEELVGEIHDETDVEEEAILRLGRNEVAASGSVELRELNHHLKIALPHIEHRTLSGYLADLLGRVPDKDETIALPDCEIVVIEATDTQVLRARVRKRVADEDLAAGGNKDGEAA